VEFEFITDIPDISHYRVPVSHHGDSLLHAQGNGLGLVVRKEETPCALCLPTMKNEVETELGKIFEAIKENLMKGLMRSKRRGDLGL